MIDHATQEERDYAACWLPTAQNFKMQKDSKGPVAMALPWDVLQHLPPPYVPDPPGQAEVNPIAGLEGQNVRGEVRQEERPHPETQPIIRQREEIVESGNRQKVKREPKEESFKVVSLTGGPNGRSSRGTRICKCSPN